ncbi:MAG: tetratricopeptide repeat protein [Bacteroidales bacterium]|nr:tetratricopeptide repeat protein [Bacteroidales bacterium]
MNLSLFSKKKNLKYILFITLAVILATMSTYWITSLSYRNKIPQLPALTNLPEAFQEQLKYADKIAKRNPTSDNLGYLGMVYHSGANYENAKTCYQLAVKRNKENWIWNYYLGHLYKELSEETTSISCFQDIVKKQPANYFAWYYLGEAYLTTGSITQAEIAFNKASDFRFDPGGDRQNKRTDLFPLEVYAKYQLARLYIKNNQPDKAETTLKDIISNYKTFGPSYRLMANVFNTRGDIPWSKYYMTRANDLNENSTPVDTLIDRLSRLSRSDLYLLKKIDEAYNSYNPEWTVLLLKNGLRYIPDNKYLISKALKLFIKMDSLDLGLSLMNQHLQKYKKEDAELKEVAELLSDKQLNAQALVYYKQLQENKSDNPVIITGMAMSMWETGKKKESLELITKMLTDAGKDTSALMEGVYFLIITNEFALAKQYLSELTKIAPNNTKIAKYSGMISETEGNFNKAIISYEKH